MSLPAIFELCDPRPDILAGTATDADFAADLSHVVRGTGGPAEYADPGLFFANTYPTRGLKSLLANVCARLSGRGGAVAATFRLDTSFGGGKTHGLIALVHAARGMQGVADSSEFVDPALLPAEGVRVAAFDGENADPANGRRMAEGVLAFTPWGEIASALAGAAGYERVRRSDEQGVAPGAETIAELFGGQPALVLLDELAIYLRKVKGRPGARDQLTAFLTSLFKAVEASPRAALVYTLAVGKEGRSTDAYGEENEFVAGRMAEAESVSARKATLLNPTEDDETVHVLRRRLFGRVDADGAVRVVEAYRGLWHDHRGALAPEAANAETAAAFLASYPLHPDLLDTFTDKTATLANFQRVRGMLRIIGRTVARLWETRPGDATAIHLHHIDPGFEPVRQEIVTRLGQSIYVPAIRNDVAGEQGRRSLAQEIDDEQHRGMPPYAAYVARTVLIHSLAFNDQLKGVSPEHLRYSILGPRTDISFIEAARQRFVAGSAYLDDRPGAPMRFLAEATDTMDFVRGELVREPDARVMCFSGRGGEVPSADGTWRSVSRDEAKRRFRDGEADILLCTDAAAEGLNFQFCGALINNDMPWNPMRVEQRIGRIDRLGQLHPVICIVNLHYADTVEADVYLALRQRIGLFQKVVGRLQPILARLPSLIADQVRNGSAADADRRRATAADLGAEAEEAAQGAGFDIDAVTEADLATEVRPRSPITMPDLERVVATPPLRPPGSEASPLGPREYAFRMPGLTGSVRISTDPDYYEQHADTVELWSPGNPTFPEPTTEVIPQLPTAKSLDALLDSMFAA